MANVLKSDISARTNLVAGQELTEIARADVRAAASRFYIFVGVLLLISLAATLAYGSAKQTFWALEGTLILALIWWVSLVAPQAIRLHHARSQLRAVEHGLQGEEAVASALEGLPSDYYVINDITIALACQETQIDHVVVTPTEVLCLETKNWKGIYRPGRAGWLWRPLHRREGRPRWHKDPQAQSLMHSEALREYLKSRGFKVRIQALVVLADPEKIEWQGTQVSTQCPVLYLYDLIPFIQARPMSKSSPEMQERVAQTILQAHIKQR